MYSGNQNTILNEVSFFGKPKNSEKVVNVKFLPSAVNSGIVFKRIDLKENNIIPANCDNSYIENNRLVLKNSNGVTINNGDQLLAGIWAARIDNITIELDGDSIPHVDGTAEPFSFLLTAARNKELEKSRKIFELEREIGVKVDNFEISTKPSKSFIISLREGNNSFEFNNSELPFKDWLSKISDTSDEKIKFDLVSIIAIIFLTGGYCTFDVKLNNFDKKITHDFFKNIFNKCK